MRTPSRRFSRLPGAATRELYSDLTFATTAAQLGFVKRC
jgi:hypothetical protein